MKWLRFGLLIALIVAAPTLVAQAEDKEKVVDTTAYYPLAVGNTWHYKTDDNKKFVMKVTKFEPVDKKMCARIELLMDNKLEAYEQIAVEKDGVYRFSYEGKKTEPAPCILKLPPKSGETWEINAKSGGDVLKGTFKEGEEKEVKVPAGTYKTVTVSTDDFDANNTKISFTTYYAENVGMVKQKLTVNGKETIIELEKFEAGKK